MRLWLLLSLCLLLLGVLVACGPSPEGGGASRGGATAGMCPNCGCTSFDVERYSERSAHTGEPTEYLRLTCRECGHSWTTPTLAEQH